MGDAPQDDEEETPRERLITNLVLLGLAVLLIGGGIWLANAIFNMRRVQDCAMAGRRNCERIEVPPRSSDKVPTQARSYASLPGLPRQSITSKRLFAKEMDARVKPGHNGYP